ncbi:hypothetical protein [Roseovarius sp. M141]|uniref:hypothetical protein n=1 Tax=Roseovarius sp. M141 TaxID=2583806 RepID=UPI0020CBE06E|nr:hypothetical protein [Roseovarius sp. M141]MCQ0092611.1 hypothetical protein [Roseovarius sp. M141]
MPRWMFFVPVIALIAASAVIGLSLGRKAVRGAETDVIVQIAARYVAETGGTARPTDCTARPAVSEGLWLVITCAAPGRGGQEYFIDHFGAVRDVGQVPAHAPHGD